MKRARGPATAAILVLALAPCVFGACGLLFTHGPPSGHENMTAFYCTESTTGPVVDIVFGAVNLIASIAIANDPDNDYYSSSGQAVASGVVWGVIMGASAGVGFDRVKKCVAAKRQLAERLAHAPGGATAGVVQTVLVMGERDTLIVGASVQLVANAFDANQSVLPGKTFAWSSSNDAIASVSRNGFVTTHAPGIAVIAANSDNVVGTVRVVVASQR